MHNDEFQEARDSFSEMGTRICGNGKSDSEIGLELRRCGVKLRELGLFSDAKDYLRNACALLSEVALELQGKWERAEKPHVDAWKDYQIANLHQVVAKREMAIAMVKSDELKEAETLLKESLKIVTNSEEEARLHMYLGVVYTKLGIVQDARDQFEKALEEALQLAPTHTGADEPQNQIYGAVLDHYGDFDRHMGNHQEASSKYEKAKKHFHKDKKRYQLLHGKAAFELIDIGKYGLGRDQLTLSVDQITIPFILQMGSRFLPILLQTITGDPQQKLLKELSNALTPKSGLSLTFGSLQTYLMVVDQLLCFPKENLFITEAFKQVSSFFLQHENCHSLYRFYNRQWKKRYNESLPSEDNGDMSAFDITKPLITGDCSIDSYEIRNFGIKTSLEFAVREWDRIQRLLHRTNGTTNQVELRNLVAELIVLLSSILDHSLNNLLSSLPGRLPDKATIYFPVTKEAFETHLTWLKKNKIDFVDCKDSYNLMMLLFRKRECGLLEQVRLLADDCKHIRLVPHTVTKKLHSQFGLIPEQTVEFTIDFYDSKMTVSTIYKVLASSHLQSIGETKLEELSRQTRLFLLGRIQERSNQIIPKWKAYMKNLSKDCIVSHKLLEGTVSREKLIIQLQKDIEKHDQQAETLSGNIPSLLEGLEARGIEEVADFLIKRSNQTSSVNPDISLNLAEFIPTALKEVNRIAKTFDRDSKKIRNPDTSPQIPGAARSSDCVNTLRTAFRKSAKALLDGKPCQSIQELKADNESFKTGDAEEDDRITILFLQHSLKVLRFGDRDCFNLRWGITKSLYEKYVLQGFYLPAVDLLHACHSLLPNHIMAKNWDRKWRESRDEQLQKMDSRKLHKDILEQWVHARLQIIRIQRMELKAATVADSRDILYRGTILANQVAIKLRHLLDQAIFRFARECINPSSEPVNFPNCWEKSLSLKAKALYPGAGLSIKDFKMEGILNDFLKKCPEWFQKLNLVTNEAKHVQIPLPDASKMISKTWPNHSILLFLHKKGEKNHATWDPAVPFLREVAEEVMILLEDFSKKERTDSSP